VGANVRVIKKTFCDLNKNNFFFTQVILIGTSFMLLQLFHGFAYNENDTKTVSWWYGGLKISAPVVAPD